MLMQAKIQSIKVNSITAHIILWLKLTQKINAPCCLLLDCVWNVMAHAQKPDFVFRRKGWVHFNWRGRQFSRLLAAEVCASAVVMLDTPCYEIVWRVLAIHSIRQFLLHFPSRASPCAITFKLDSTNWLQQKFVCSRLPWMIVAYPALTHDTACWSLRLEIQSTVKEANIYLAAAAKSITSLYAECKRKSQ